MIRTRNEKRKTQSLAADFNPHGEMQTKNKEPGMERTRAIPGLCVGSTRGLRYATSPALWRLLFSALRVHGMPLTLTLSPEYRGEGNRDARYIWLYHYSPKILRYLQNSLILKIWKNGTFFVNANL